jgi:hypothetical protein
MPERPDLPTKPRSGVGLDELLGEYARRSDGKTLAPALHARSGAGRHSNAGKPRPDAAEVAVLCGNVQPSAPPWTRSA